MIAEISLFSIIANGTYFALAAVALWGLYCIVVVWNRVGQKRFKTEEEQDIFLDDIEQLLAKGDFEAALEYCEGDTRAVPQMIELAVNHRQLGYKRARRAMMDRFQRDVLSDLEYRLSWISTVIKSAPMIGLFGTVFGMMGAFQTLATATSVEPSKLAGDIQLALITTASGLAIAIPLMLLVANLNIKIAKMEDLVGSGLARFFEAFKTGLARTGGQV
ncbi:MotA/TolQ/ExbB proton channel family protein [Roseiconus lacunae]|uniref:MotA/TolQ/ExbB proton channel family protein n=1 Tax=Roseiconus lacunae TaxID=2605694 RepID=A0ABT7PFV5_9BACT|nr:MotA/TolQ/ExbB proton channel family protein [Roseiconus lacunae]MCD0461452.1 MotA/TolQ/ExbB proton channel family protein [Roseiconus lacunae]MDM4015351.1 MotA/TolQ/ExbB proton channel family protein [Roseiconus lacunae]WRQ52971.1 MotA/TolQ/ExbB proton channel family protein [Stieleria sp. HD01]